MSTEEEVKQDTPRKRPVVFALFKPRKLEVARMAKPVRLAGSGKEGRRGCFTTWLRDLEEEAELPAESLFAIGRLDKETSGLLLVTDDGDLVYALTRKGACSKRYLATCMVRDDMVPDQPLQPTISGEHDAAPWPLFKEAVHRRLCTEGVFLSEQVVDRGRVVPGETVRCETVNLLDVRTERREVPVKREKKKKEEEDGNHPNHEASTSSTAGAGAEPAAEPQMRMIEKKRVDVALDIRVGLYRVVRRILAAIGLPVHHLKRDAVGCLELGKGELSDLDESQHVRLSDQAVEQLWSHLGGRQSLAAHKAFDNAKANAATDAATRKRNRDPHFEEGDDE